MKKPIDEMGRQIEMGWNRGFQLGLVSGGVGALVLGGIVIGFFFAGSFFSKDAEVQIVSERDVTLKHLKMEGLENLDMDYIKYTVNKRVEEERAEREKADEEYRVETEKRRLEYEASRLKWLKDHPPVDELWDDSQKDLEYTINYIRENWYHGDCALVWRSDVVCWNDGFIGVSLVFPTKRPTECPEGEQLYLSSSDAQNNEVYKCTKK